MKRPTRKIIVSTLLALAAVSAALAAVAQQGAPAQKPREKLPFEEGQAKERFDLIVREDFFAGMFGNWDRLEKGMRRCEEELAKNPDHAEALVWHGGGLLMRAVRAYTQGETRTGDKLWRDGIAEMDRARALAPKDMGVKIGRAALLLGIAQSGFDPSDAEALRLMRTSVEDYESVYAIQEPHFPKISQHSKCELIFGLATGWSLLGDEAKSRQSLERAVQHCGGSEYEKRARTFLAGKGVPAVKHTCIGCH